MLIKIRYPNHRHGYYFLCFFEKDTELQAWIGDLHDNGYPARGAENSHGFPSSVTSLEQLAHILTMVIFTCSSQHAAVNFSQLDAYGFQPHTPSLMRQLPPKTKGLVNEEHIMNSLPTNIQTAVTITVVFDLTQKFDDEVYISCLNKKFRYIRCESATKAQTSDKQPALFLRPLTVFHFC